MAKLNCWDHKKCGREPGGSKVGQFGICSATTEVAANGIHEGTNAGRVCWAVAGTLCEGNVQGSFASKLEGCGKCDFYAKVMEEEMLFMDNIDILYEIKMSKKKEE